MLRLLPNTDAVLSVFGLLTGGRTNRHLETETYKTENLQRFINKVKQLTEIKELTPELIHEFIDKIVVNNPGFMTPPVRRLETAIPE